MSDDFAHVRDFFSKQRQAKRDEQAAARKAKREAKRKPPRVKRVKEDAVSKRKRLVSESLDAVGDDLVPTRTHARHPHVANVAALTETEREYVIARCARLYLQGHKQAEIAEMVGVSRETVTRYLKTMTERWKEHADLDFNEAKANALERLDQLEREAWLAWEESLKESTKTTLDVDMDKTGSAKPSRQRVVRSKSGGNPAFLMAIFQCIDRRIKLLGLDAAEHFVIERAGGATGENNLESRLAKYEGVFVTGIVGIATQHLDRDGAEQSLDSKRSASEAGGVLDASYELGPSRS